MGSNYSTIYRFAILILGFTAIVTQTILLREFLVVFNGNELVIGIILSAWMMLTALGAYIVKFIKNFDIKHNLIWIFHFLLALLPIASFFLLYYFKNLFIPFGSTANILTIFYITVSLLAPFCLVSGSFFTIITSMISELSKSNKIAQVYATESIGSIAGGFFFNTLVLLYVNIKISLVILLIINLIMVLLFLFKKKNKILKITATLIVIALISLFYLLDPVTNARNSLFKNQEVILTKETPYGIIVVTESNNQLNYYENGVFLFSSENTISNEEAVHYAMIQHPSPRNILLISGGISGITNEILKYDVARIDYLEINPMLIETAKKYTNTLNDPKIHIINKDARLYIKRMDETYDIILINIPPPLTLQLNRYFTQEFFNELHQKLDKKGIISLALPSSGNYLSKEALLMNSSICNTLRSVFKNVILVPGNQNYYIASDTALDLNIADKIMRSGINNTYVNQYYIIDDILKQRSELIIESLDDKVKVNKDFNPTTYYFQLLHWLSLDKVNFRIPFVLILLITIIVLIRLKPVTLGLFTGGFSASSLEIILLISFQIIFGYVYLITGIIITLFMAGLALGSFSVFKLFRVNYINYAMTSVIIGIIAFSIPFVLNFITKEQISTFPIQLIFYFLTILIAMVIGVQFAFASILRTRDISRIAGENYSIDLFGSALGALLITILLIPFLGITYTVIVIAILNLITALIITITGKKYVSL
ncbi:fused MFS/spermidine synthase [candidate division KSB1 bacterium]